MRISDWSSDVCSSDLLYDREEPATGIVSNKHSALLFNISPEMACNSDGASKHSIALSHRNSCSKCSSVSKRVPDMVAVRVQSFECRGPRRASDAISAFTSTEAVV